MPHNIINEPWCVSELAQMVSDFWRQTFLSDSLETKSLYLPWVLTPKRMSKHLIDFDWLRLIKRAVSCLSGSGLVGSIIWLAVTAVSGL